MDIGNVLSTYHLSPIQLDLLRRHLDEEAEGLPKGQFTLMAQGELDWSKWQHACRRMVVRHDVLRTFFVWQGMRRPRQILCKQLAMPLDYEDWREIPEGDRRKRWEALCRQEGDRTFDLSRAPLLRLAVRRMDERHWRMVGTYHPLILDAKSVHLMVDHLMRDYECLVRGWPLKDATFFPWSDYVTWLKSQATSEAAPYWNQVLKDFREPAQIPANRSNALESNGFAWVRVHPTRSFLAQYRPFCRRWGLDFEALYLGALIFILSTLSGHDTLYLGASFDGPPSGFGSDKPMVGPLSNRLPLRVRVCKTAPLNAWLKRVSEDYAACVTHRHLPLTEALNMGGLGNPLHLFDILFHYERDRAPSFSGRPFGALQVKEWAASHEGDHALMFQVMTNPEECLHLGFDADRYEPSSAETLLFQICHLLEVFLRRPEDSLASFSPIPADTRRRLLTVWQGPATQAGEQAQILQWFVAQADTVPDSVALVGPPYQSGEVTNPRHVSYGALNRETTRLAGYLREFGVGPELLVGIYMGRCVEQALAVLAVIKAGGAFVPLEPMNPYERLVSMMEDAFTSIILTLHPWEGGLPAMGSQVITLGEDWPFVNPDPQIAPVSSNLRADNVAYVIFTSGSTGRPKGVMVSHRALDNLCRWYADYFLIHRDTAVIQALSTGFDAAIKNTLSPLIAGGKVVLYPEGIFNPVDLLATIENQRIQVMNNVPSTFHLLLEHAADQNFRPLASLRHLVLGGESPDPQRLRPWLEGPYGLCQVTNVYGPTETADSSLAWRFDPQDGRAFFPIGLPILNTRAHLLGPRLDPIAPGFRGELTLAGTGLARGYLGRPGSTAASYVPDPHGVGGRLYRTGDNALRLLDGNIVYLGRSDRQVKLRGFRIELGEVEAALQGIHFVRTCAVSVAVPAHANDGDPLRLVAFIVDQNAPEEDPPPAEGALCSGEQVSELRALLKHRLPEFMIPEIFVTLPSLPLTRSGKLDRRALPNPFGLSSVRKKAHAESRNPVEQILTGLWLEILDVPAIDRDDNFFELGGQSLSATQLLSRIQKTFHAEITFQEFFAKPTIADIAKILGTALQSSSPVKIPPLVAMPRGDQIPLSHAQQRLWLVHKLLADNNAYHIATPLELRGSLNVAAMERALATILSRHEALRTRFIVGENEPIQVIAPLPSFGLPVVALDGLDETERDETFRAILRGQRDRGFDLGEDQLVRMHMVATGPRVHTLALTMHHIVSDGWSVGLLVRELMQLYKSFASGKPNPLETLSLQYADYAIWQRQWLRDEVLEHHLTYWRDQLAGAPLLQNLPKGAVRPQRPTAKAESRMFAFGEELSQAIRALGRREGATDFMVLLAGFKVLMFCHEMGEKIVVGTDVANRNHPDLETIIGFFINQLILRTDLSGNPDFRQILDRVRRTCLQAYAHQDVPYDQVVGALLEQRTPDINPFFQIKLVYQNLPASELHIPGLELNPLPLDLETTKLDMQLNMWEGGATGGARPSGARQMMGAFNFKTDVFDAATISRLIRHFQVVFTLVTTGEDLTLEAIRHGLAAADREYKETRLAKRKSSGIKAFGKRSSTSSRATSITGR